MASGISIDPLPGSWHIVWQTHGERKNSDRFNQTLFV